MEIYINVNLNTCEFILWTMFIADHIDSEED